MLKYELYHDSALSRFLLRRALRSREVGHALYWYLKSEMHVPTITERYGLLLEAYLRGCGSHRQELKKQEEVLVLFLAPFDKNSHLIAKLERNDSNSQQD